MQRILVNEYTLKNQKIAKNNTIVCISDIHNNIEALKNIQNFLKCLNLNLICIPGDILNFADPDYSEELLDTLGKIGEMTNTYISIGNHDMIRYGRKNKLCRMEIPDYNHDFFDRLDKNSNCTILGDEFMTESYDNNITINALNMPYYFYGKNEDKKYFIKTIENIDSEYDPNTFNILLSHSPNCFIKNNNINNEYKLINDMDLILCGHNHGGLTPLFIQDLSKNHIGLIGPYSKIIQENAYGYYTNDNNSLIINNGVTKVSGSAKAKKTMYFLENFFTPEIDLIHLKPGNSNKLELNKRLIKRI